MELCKKGKRQVVGECFKIFRAIELEVISSILESVVVTYQNFGACWKVWKLIGKMDSDDLLCKLIANLWLKLFTRTI